MKKMLICLLWIVLMGTMPAFTAWEGCQNPTITPATEYICRTVTPYYSGGISQGTHQECGDETRYYNSCPVIGGDNLSYQSHESAYSRAVDKWNSLPHPVSNAICNSSNSDYQKLGLYTGCLSRPILFVHGLATDAGSWRGYSHESLVMYQLAETYGAHKTHTIETGIGEDVYFEHNGLELYNAAHKFQPIETSGNDQTELLENRIREVLTEYYGEEWKNDFTKTLDIVAHSQGGLVVRNALRRYSTTSPVNPLNHIHGIISLNTPHTGSAIATDGSDNADVQRVRSLALSTHSHERLKGFKNVHEILGAFIYGTQDLSQKSDFIKGLTAEGYPRTPYNNLKIPMVALSSTAKNMGLYLLKAVEIASEKCNSVNVDAGEVHEENCHWEWTWNVMDYVRDLKCESKNVGGDIADVFVDGYELGWDLVITTGHSWNEGEWDWYSRNDAAQYLCNEAADVAIDILWDNYLKGLNDNWADRSDFIVEISSQEGHGVFKEGTDPFKIMNVNALTGAETIPHMPMLVFPNGVYYGSVFVQAYKELNELKDMSNRVPAIITPLLLN